MSFTYNNTNYTTSYTPLDYINCEVIDTDINDIINYSNVQFTGKFNQTTGEEIQQNKIFGNLDNLKFKYVPETTTTPKLYLQGSIHKYNNDGLHNYNDFDKDALNESLSKLHFNTGILPKNLRLKGIECGYNFNTPCPVETALNHTLYWGKKPFKHFQYGIGKESGTSKETLSFYAKGAQHRIDECLGRIELKIKDWSPYRLNYNLNTLEDLIKFDQTIFINKLLNAWNSVIFINPDLKPEHLLKYSSSYFWEHELGTTKNSSKRKYHVDKLKKLNRACADDLYGQITNSLKNKIQELNLKSTINKTCVLTGIDISMQRSESHLLSHTGLNHLEFNDPEKYLFIKCKFLTANWSNTTKAEQHKRIAHNIRAAYIYKEKNKVDNQLPIF